MVPPEPSRREGGYFLNPIYHTSCVTITLMRERIVKLSNGVYWTKSWRISFLISVFAFSVFPLTADAGVIGKPPNYLTVNQGLVGWWTFDGPDMTGGTVWDRSGQGNHGSAIGMATSTMYAAGKIGQALKFDGVDDFVRVGNQSSLNFDETKSFFPRNRASGRGAFEIASRRPILLNT